MDVVRNCPICLEEFEGRETGSPDICDHVFCLSCLQKWAKQASICPLDKKRFKKIINLSNFEPIQVKPKKRKRQKALYDVSSHCEVCSKSSGENTLLLCDCCDLAYHLACLSPPLKSVPSGIWHCPVCVDISERMKLKKGHTKDVELLARSLFRPSSSENNFEGEPLATSQKENNNIFNISSSRKNQPDKNNSKRCSTITRSSFQEKNLLTESRTKSESLSRSSVPQSINAANTFLDNSLPSSSSETDFLKDAIGKSIHSNSKLMSNNPETNGMDKNASKIDFSSRYCGRKTYETRSKKSLRKIENRRFFSNSRSLRPRHHLKRFDKSFFTDSSTAEEDSLSEKNLFDDDPSPIQNFASDSSSSRKSPDICEPFFGTFVPQISKKCIIMNYESDTEAAEEMDHFGKSKSQKAYIEDSYALNNDEPINLTNCSTNFEQSKGEPLDLSNQEKLFNSFMLKNSSCDNYVSVTHNVPPCVIKSSHSLKDMDIVSNDIVNHSEIKLSSSALYKHYTESEIAKLHHHEDSVNKKELSNITEVNISNDIFKHSGIKSTDNIISKSTDIVKRHQPEDLSNKELLNVTEVNQMKSSNSKENILNDQNEEITIVAETKKLKSLNLKENTFNDQNKDISIVAEVSKLKSSNPKVICEISIDDDLVTEVSSIDIVCISDDGSSSSLAEFTTFGNDQLLTETNQFATKIQTSGAYQSELLTREVCANDSKKLIKTDSGLVVPSLKSNLSACGSFCSELPPDIISVSDSIISDDMTDNFSNDGTMKSNCVISSVKQFQKTPLFSIFEKSSDENLSQKKYTIIDQAVRETINQAEQNGNSTSSINKASCSFSSLKNVTAKRTGSSLKAKELLKGLNEIEKKKWKTYHSLSKKKEKLKQRLQCDKNHCTDNFEGTVNYSLKKYSDNFDKLLAITKPMWGKSKWNKFDAVILNCAKKNSELYDIGSPIERVLKTYIPVASSSLSKKTKINDLNCKDIISFHTKDLSSVIENDEDVLQKVYCLPKTKHLSVRNDSELFIDWQHNKHRK